MGPASAGPTARSRFAAAVRAVARRRAPAFVATGLVVTVGMVFFFSWGPISNSKCGCWVAPEDIWGAVRSAHFVLWGYYGGIYAAGTQLVTFPGYLLTLLPAVSLSTGLKLAEPYPLVIRYPSAWLVIGPYTMALGSVVLFALDGWLERCGIPRRRRWLAAVIGGSLLWPVLALWGHPEDPIAVALALWAIAAAHERHYARSGWLFGAAIAIQPLALLVLPIGLGIVGLKRVVPTTIRAGLPSVALLVVPLIANFHATARAILEQPNYPRIDFPTPWMALAPRLSAVSVAAGPGRMIAMVGALAIGVWLLLRRDSARDPAQLLWLGSVAFALRCVFESVMVPYYVWPVVALAVAAAATSSWRRLVIAFAIASLLCGVTYVHLARWPYWLAMTSLIVLLSAVAAPQSIRRSSVAGDAGRTVSEGRDVSAEPAAAASAGEG